MTEHEYKHKEQTGWVEVESYFNDSWRTPWPLENLTVRLDHKPVILSKMIEHKKRSKQDD
jgi:hypothetical protein